MQGQKLKMIPGITDAFLENTIHRTGEFSIRQELTNSVINRFRWTGNVTNLEYIELFLICNGAVSIANDRLYGLIINPFVSLAGYNALGYPIEISQWNFYGSNFEPTNDFVVMYDNVSRYPNYLHIIKYASELAQIDKAIKANLKSVKAGIGIISESPATDLSYKTIANQLEQDNGFLFLRDKNFFDNNLKAFSLNTNIFALDLMALYREKFNSFLTLEGINNVDIIKRERLISSEANSNNELIMLNLENWLKPRKRFCELVNEKYPSVNLSCEIVKAGVTGV